MMVHYMRLMVIISLSKMALCADHSDELILKSLYRVINQTNARESLLKIQNIIDQATSQLDFNSGFVTLSIDNPLINTLHNVQFKNDKIDQIIFDGKYGMDIGDICSVSKWPLKLESLIIENLPNLRLHSLDCIPNTVEYFHLSHLNSIDFSMWKNWDFNSKPNLMQIEMVYLSSDDQTLHGINFGNNTLKTLVLHGFDGIDFASVYLPDSLETLNIDGNEISLKAMSEIKLERLENLEILDISDNGDSDVAKSEDYPIYFPQSLGVLTIDAKIVQSIIHDQSPQSLPNLYKLEIAICDEDEIDAVQLGHDIERYFSVSSEVLIFKDDD